MPNTKDLDALIEKIESIARAASAQGGDAIDKILASPGRETQVKSLRDTEVVSRFHKDLIDGLIQIDTANQLFRLIRTILDQLPFIAAGT
jgi:hypothetical protein